MSSSSSLLFYPRGETGVLIIHGLSSSNVKYREFSKFLADNNISVKAPILSGHGTNPIYLRDYHAEDWIREISDEIRDFKKVARKIYLLGDSFGGNIALKLASQNNISGLILVSTPVYLTNHRWRKFLLSTLGLVKRYYIKENDSSFQTCGYSKIPVVSIRKMLKFITKETFFDLPCVKIPTLIFHSLGDKVVDKESAYFLYKKIGSANKKLFWVDNKTHSLLTSNKKDIIFKEILKFIRP